MIGDNPFHMTITRQSFRYEDSDDIKIIPVKWRKPRRPRKEKKWLKKIGCWPPMNGFLCCGIDGYYPEITDYESLSITNLKGKH